jgi:cytochrome c2
MQSSIKKLKAPIALWGALTLAAVISACGGAQAPLQDVPGGSPQQGQQAISRYGCGACHVIPGVRGANATVGPPLTSFARREYVGGVVPNTPDNLIRWVMNPPAIAPQTAMPNLGVSEADARHIAAYLYTLR